MVDEGSRKEGEEGLELWVAELVELNLLLHEQFFKLQDGVLHSLHILVLSKRSNFSGHIIFLELLRIALVEGANGFVF